jgi:hypothetical protein
VCAKIGKVAGFLVQSAAHMTQASSVLRTHTGARIWQGPYRRGLNMLGEWPQRLQGWLHIQVARASEFGQRSMIATQSDFPSACDGFDVRDAA